MKRHCRLLGIPWTALALVALVSCDPVVGQRFVVAGPSPSEPLPDTVAILEIVGALAAQHGLERLRYPSDFCDVAQYRREVPQAALYFLSICVDRGGMEGLNISVTEGGRWSSVGDSLRNALADSLRSRFGEELEVH